MKMEQIQHHICIHGHFYQPPRENAWLDTILMQKSAHPYHNWNERILAECYTPNTRARLLQTDGKIVDIRNNFADISFNIGPTLLAWMEKYAPKTYEAILEADRIGALKYNFSGPAIAQVYNHTILPLATQKDKIIQIKWGIADFQHRFGRQPEGMWLAETAVDIESLEVLASEGIRFTILAPWQAAQWRNISSGTVWQSGIDPRYPYVCRLPSGQQITLFFYHGKLAGDIAFGQLLEDGKKMANELSRGFDPENSEPQLVHIATDGETFGHHHRFGEMALAYCLHDIDQRNDIQLLPYGAFLDKYPVLREVEIVSESSWSCMHGIERWRSDCGCKTGGDDQWNQAWRAPLRQALDILKIKLDQWYQSEMAAILPHRDPHAILLQYGEVITRRSDSIMDNFARKLGLDTSLDQNKLFRLLEMQRNGQLMFTSCGWFFNDIAGIETTQVLQYACRAIQLMVLSGGPDISNIFIEKLAEARSNDPAKGNGADIYRSAVLAEEMTMERVAIFMAALHMMRPGDLPEIWNYSGRYVDWQKHHRGAARMEYGTINIHSATTLGEETMYVLVVYAGGLRLFGYAAPMIDTHPLFTNLPYLLDLFKKGQWEIMEAELSALQGGNTFSFSDLLHDEQAMLAAAWLHKVEEDPQPYPNGFTESDFGYLEATDIPIPLIFKQKISISLLNRIQKCLQTPYHYHNNLEIERLLREHQRWSIDFPAEELILAWKGYFEGMQNIAFACDEAHISGLKRLLEEGKAMRLTCDTASLVLTWRKWFTEGSHRLPEHVPWRSLLAFLEISDSFNWGRR